MVCQALFCKSFVKKGLIVRSIICTDTGEVCSSYSSYKNTKHWHLLRARFKASKYFNKRCAKCKKVMSEIQIHHRHYDTLGRENLFDLVALCPRCHQAVHSKPFKKGNWYKAAESCWGREEYGTYEVDKYLESMR